LIGLQIRSGIPRELGGALIALLLLFIATSRFSNGQGGNSSLHATGAPSQQPESPL
jgi:hypothetical protein